MSQEELSERIYISRQTISSWENGKTYPDINSLVMLSEVFDMTIDNLVKGDLEIMEQKIEQTDISNMRKNYILSAIFLAVALVMLPLSMYLGSVPGLFIAVPAAAATIYFSCKAEKIKKQYDVQTYREIIAFSKGETLDEIAKIRESGKRCYQKFLFIAVAAILGFLASHIVWQILQVI
jgi:transcriptional regulator with XRE-family HTH domain